MHFILPEYLMQKDQGKLSMEETVDTLKRAGVPEDEMAALERQLAPSGALVKAPKEGIRAVSFVSGGVEGAVKTQADNGQFRNPDEIELGEEEGSDAENETGGFTEKQIPDAVFGKLADKKQLLEQQEDTTGKPEDRESDDAPLGALERFKRQRRQ